MPKPKWGIVEVNGKEWKFLATNSARLQSIHYTKSKAKGIPYLAIETITPSKKSIIIDFYSAPYNLKAEAQERLKNVVMRWLNTSMAIHPRVTYSGSWGSLGATLHIAPEVLNEALEELALIALDEDNWESIWEEL